MSLISRWHNCRLKREYEDIQKVWGNRERPGKKAQCLCFLRSTLNFPDSYFSSTSPFSSFSSCNCPLQQKASNQKVSAGLCPRNKKKIVCQWFTQTTVNMYMSSYLFSLSPSFLFLPFVPHFIPH